MQEASKKLTNYSHTVAMYVAKRACALNAIDATLLILIHLYVHISTIKTTSKEGFKTMTNKDKTLITKACFKYLGMGLALMILAAIMFAFPEIIAAALFVALFGVGITAISITGIIVANKED